MEILVGHHDQAGADTYQHIGAQSCRAIFHSALQSDDSAKKKADRVRVMIAE